MWDGRPATLASLRDVTDRVEAEHKLRRLARMHCVLSGINNLIVRVDNRDDLFSGAVRIAVQEGRLPFAWLGTVDKACDAVSLAAWHGGDKSLRNLVRTRLSTPISKWHKFDLVTRAIKEQRPIIADDLHADNAAGLDHGNDTLGIQAIAAFPLMLDQEVEGILVLHAREKNFFDKQETKLLLELASDISFALDHLEKAKRLDYLANYDTVTGLPNRALLKDRLNQALHFANRYQLDTALLFVDLDRFKLINDTLGHACGDEVLRVAANRIATCVRKTDTVARQGGDEFVVVLAGNQTDERTISRTAQRIVDSFSKPIIINNREVFVTCSIGVAHYAGGDIDAETLLRHADTAMYRVKEHGGNNFQNYRVGYDRHSQERLSIETALRRATHNGELSLVYQPKVDLDTGYIYGVEALVRWQHPERGPLPPSDFIPIAEETGVILQIGEWVLEHACAQSKAWDNLHMAVNLSARQFRQSDLTKIVSRVLRDTQLDPNVLELELTESMLIQDVELAIRTMKELKKLGVHISLDDFGIGYSSLSYLKRFPIDTLKIDRSFVREMTTDTGSAAIIDAIITMARSLKLLVVAEGVETVGQLKALRDRGCHQSQGYLFAEPLAAQEIEQLLQNGRRLILRLKDR